MSPFAKNVMKMLNKFFSTRLELNYKQLVENLNYLKYTLEDKTEIIAVLKANAYGFGDVLLVEKILNLGIKIIAVADFEEGLRLRKMGIKNPIIIMYPGVNNLEPIIKNNLEPTIFSLLMLEKLINHAKQTNEIIPFHLKFDTGMNRYGLSQFSCLDEVIEKIKSQKNIFLKSVFSHFSSSNNTIDNTTTNNQINSFKKLKKIIDLNFDHIINYHISNSFGVLNFPEANFDMVRVGYGIYYGFNKSNSKCIATLKSTISQIKNIKAGDSVGYNRKFIAKKNMKIGILPIGYADGLRRSWVKKGLSFYYNRISLPVVGEISMDSCIIDLKQINNIQPGCEVELFGSNRDIFDLCSSLDVIPYELTSCLSKRIRRVIV